MVQGNKIKFGIIGCGLIGRKRFLSLAKDQVSSVCDLDLKRAQDLASLSPGCSSTVDYRQVLDSKEVDAVIVATLNASLAPIALAAVEAGKHVLVEKPGAISALELERIESVATRNGTQVRIGFNHRYHPAFIKAYELLKSGALGPLMFIRARYGHGGRVGYDQEWRADPRLSGGGELMDQGVHLIDLAGSFLGEFTTVEGNASTYYWNMPVDDNAFLNLRNAGGQTAWLQVSCTEWKNLFSFEVYGKNAKLHIEGLGGSYGVERLYYYKMLPQMGPPDTLIYEFPSGDSSWKLEMDAFQEDIRKGRVSVPGLKEGIATLKIVEEIYKKSGYR